MALVANNSPIQHIRGKLGDALVFRRCGDKTVVSVKASPRRKNSALQELSVNRFREAATYARTVLRDPVKREHYTRLAKKLRKHCAYNVAISEYMLSVRIALKEGNGSAAASRDTKRVKLTVTKKDFKIKEVAVEVFSKDGERIAEGKANAVSACEYVVMLPVQPPEGCWLTVTATDALGLRTVKDLWY